MNLGKLIKKLWKFAVDNYFISIFLACIAFVVLVSGYKLFLTKPAYVYVRVKMGQGLWWASTAKAPIWFVESIKKNQKQNDLLGKPLVKIINMRYYPWYTSSQYDVYLTLQLRVSGNKKTGRYSFNRSAIGVGSPIDLEFPSTQFSGTIIQLQTTPFQDFYIEKVITLEKKWAYSWEADAIAIGDKYFDGEKIVFEIIDKQIEDSQEVYSISGTYYPVETERKKNIIIKARIKVKQTDSQLIFAEEQTISLGKTLNISTSKFTFTDYIISKME